MCVWIDHARQDQHAGRVDDVLAFRDALANLGDLAGADENVGFPLGVRGDDGSTSDQHVVTPAKAGSDADLVQVARIEVKAPTEERLHEILGIIHDHGAIPVHVADGTLVPADLDGAFPEGFYCTTNFRSVRYGLSTLGVVAQYWRQRLHLSRLPLFDATRAAATRR